jgi:hypothetical protein
MYYKLCFKVGLRDEAKIDLNKSKIWHGVVKDIKQLSSPDFLPQEWPRRNLAWHI